MPIEIQWWGEHPTTGERLYLRAEKFAGQWHFKFRKQRRSIWERWAVPSRAMWDHVLDSLKRRYVRREGVSEEDITQVERIIKALPVPRDLDDEAGGTVQG
jgi:hypothetical protein